jgi:hypothetical protein
MKSQPYWTRQLVASIGEQAMCGFSCSPNGKKNVQAELVPFVVDLFDLEDEVPGVAQGFPREVDGLA